MPERIQRKRTKGWRMPEGAVYVGRPTLWANPWRLVRITADDHVVYGPVGEVVDSRGGREFAAKVAVELFRDFALAGGVFYIVELAGRDLACWCPLDQPCHADVLLKLANPPKERESSDVNEEERVG